MSTRHQIMLAVAALMLAYQPAVSQIAAPSDPSRKNQVSPGGTAGPAPADKSARERQSPVQQIKPEVSASELISQGKSLYRSARFKQALAKFEAALKQEPQNDEALGLAAVTAFRLDSQSVSRDYFIRRAELPDQKESIKAYSFYRVALTYWREAHDLVAKDGEIEEIKIVYKLDERSAADAVYKITNGLEYVERALGITSDFAEAYNVKNLLHSEAALLQADEAKADEHRRIAVESLRKALDLAELPVTNRGNESADFSKPTMRIAEFGRTKEEEDKLDDPMMKLLEGGRPIKRVHAVFPSIRSAKPSADSSDPSSKGVTSGGGAYSLGTGRGALTAAYVAGTVKVEVLIATTGDVVFAHVVEGRSDLNGSAIVAARSWKFEPARFEGRPVQVSGIITFSLKPRR